MQSAVAVGIAVVVVLVLAFAFRRRDTGYKVDEFARARSLTTEWARRSSTEPPGTVTLPDASPQEEAPRADQGRDRPAG